MTRELRSDDSDGGTSGEADPYERKVFYREEVREGTRYYEVQARRHTQAPSTVITIFDISKIKVAQMEQQRVAADLTLLIDTVRAPSLPTSVTRSPLVQPADALHILHARHRRTRPSLASTRMGA